MQTKIYGHRGAMGEYPENTMLAFKKAIEAGVDGLEIDVHLTRDGEVVVIHDEQVDRTTDGRGAVKDMDLHTLKGLSAGSEFEDFVNYDADTWIGERIPTLDEVMGLVGQHDIELNIELKTNVFEYEGIEQRVHDIVENHNYSNKVIYSSFHMPSILRMKAIDPEARIAWLTDKVPLWPIDHMEELALEALHISYKAILKNPGRIAGVEDRIRVWTVNETGDAARLLSHGVETLMTNYPERMMALSRTQQKKIEHI
ncbi:glycerophosphodiester phosphodiesterase [Salinicoccus sp. ID82-1]|uniref:glycerophosphodiester phosphodiesterase n=1 Tax=Salinicoccus sp. ID82-1 TaxID=2820269 RepID=UPI001F2873E0|nr:glycerophosphodiester phosphodiesterase [Salinicoccus sp. ID82-1]MCG1010663.1 glycerophosphodiester phosphodiesterase [Salinicoccus sp. ID82-1]